MKQVRHLSRAPIVEAAIEFRTPLRTDLDPDCFEELWPQLEEDYPGLQQKMSLEVEFRGSKQSPPEAFEKPVKRVGFRRTSTDEQRVVQLLMHGLIFSHFEPYPDWDSVFSEAWTLWNLYCELVDPPRVTRCGVRFINRFRLPIPLDLDDYFKGALPANEGPLEHFDLVDFLIRRTLVDSSRSASARISFASQEDPDPDLASIVFDIDAFRAGSFEPLSEELKAVYASLRELKNDIFFHTLTERALGEYA